MNLRSIIIAMTSTFWTFVFTRLIFEIWLVLVLHFSVNPRPKIRKQQKLKKTKQNKEIRFFLKWVFFFHSVPILLCSFRTERQWRDLAFCLSMLSYNERGIRKLQENFACFHDKLAEEDVYQSFLAIVGKSKKFAKPEVKVDLGFVVTC